MGEFTAFISPTAPGQSRHWAFCLCLLCNTQLDSTLAGASGLSPKECRRRSKFAAGDARGRGRPSSPREQSGVDGAESRRMVIMRGIVEDAAHQLLVENVANPTTRTQVLIAISSGLDAHAQAGRLAIRNPDVLWQVPAARVGR